MALTYYRNVKTTAKGRWLGKRLGEVALEFGPGARLKGDPDRVVTHHDMIEYSVHVHEPPAPSLGPPTPIIYESDEFLVINKPSGIPVHPTVNYFHNTVTEVLRNTHGNLLPCYRLDRLTSGVLILAKTQAAVSLFNNSKRHKVYYARVLSDAVPQSLRETKSMIADAAIATFNGKRGYERVKASILNAKPAQTRLQLLGDLNGLATIRAEPITGRTHQIRKHLALLGMPIHNDELYADGGKFRALIENPTPETFDAVWQFAETNRLAKLTGEVCEECGAPLYDRGIGILDLHCATYTVGDRVFEAPPPFPIASSDY